MSFRHACLFLAAALLALPAARAQTSPSIPLNDTGQTLCYDGTTTMTTCDAGNTGDGASYPRQDGRFGRDAQATAGTLTKTGGGDAGFDFTAFNGLDGNGEPVPVAPGTHLCVKDNVTGLVWSTQTFDNVDWNQATATGSGSPIYDHNDTLRCGFDDWRAPTQRELLSIVHYGKASAPAIDENYFPGTASEWYWTSDEDATGSTGAWDVSFSDGKASTSNKTNTSHRVRLVRGGQ